MIRFAVDDEETDIRFLEHVVVEVSLSLNGHSVEYDYSDYYSISSLLNVQYDKQDLDRLVYHSGARRGRRFRTTEVSSPNEIFTPAVSQEGLHQL